jgi:hypothetical protein
MLLDEPPGEHRGHSRPGLCRCDDDTVFAYARGVDFIRRSDNTLWARLSNGELRSARSGSALAYRIGNVFYDAATNEPVYYQVC